MVARGYLLLHSCPTWKDDDGVEGIRAVYGDHPQAGLHAPAVHLERQVAGLYIQAQKMNPVPHTGWRQHALIQNYGYLGLKGRRGESRSLIFFLLLKNDIIK